MRLRVRRLNTAARAVLAWLCAACHEPEAAPDERSEYVDLFYEDDVRVCGGQMLAYDAFIETAFETWTHGPPGDFRMTLRVGRDVCGEEKDGCAKDKTARVRLPLQQYHEISHVVSGAAVGSAPRTLAEGAAEALGSGQNALELPADLQMISMMELFSSPGDEFLPYSIGGPFVRFAIDTFGSDAVRSYYLELQDRFPDGDVQLDGFGEAFQPAFGEELEDAWNAFIAEQRCDYDFWYCDAAEPSDIPLAFDSIDCDADNSLFFEDLVPLSETPYHAAQLVRINDDKSLSLMMTTLNVDVRLLWCGDCSERRPNQSWHRLDNAPFEQPLDLEAGDRVFVVEAIDPTMPISFELRPAV